MDITAQNLNALSVGFRKNYQDGLTEYTPTWNMIADEIPSTSSENEYGWLGDWPSLREWIGERVIKQLSGESYKIRNKPFESTVEVDKYKIQDDNIGVYAGRFKAMGRAVSRWPDEVVWPVLSAGFSTTCYDGQNFFDTDHPVGSEQSGKRRTVSNMQDGNGPAWFLLDLSQAVKPIVWQLRLKPEFSQLIDPNSSERVFMKNKFLYGVEARANAGYSFWQMAFGSRAELNEENFKAAVSAMTSLENDEGGKLAIRPTLLVVGSSNQWKARELLETARKQDGSDNILKGAVKLQVSAYLD
ncbi:major head subunit [Roseibium sp. TrichSKD4]|uniref:Mu-like prophage major head subunit gpT family protein n=1 Tax=Roseibium sp. TrichSKD4 TaxID=744980 RepID=UPI0001E57605|nr:Mu-like prophage major head subunit gpT family protein [Roseibium sp. TrichSKD4]EFO30940.1 major head subunit [Roseibium sp. TrichSKD4]